MLRFLFLSLIVFQLSSCAQLQQVVEQLPQGQQAPTINIAAGLREALTLGIDKQVSKLTQKDGFFKNERVKIVLPEALTKVDKALRTIGLSDLADEGIKVLNRAAEDAVKEATPVFISAVKDIKFEDAKTILLGNNTSATEYLTTKTEEVLYQKFNPIIQKYNKIPFTESVNTDLTDYVTKEALKGVYEMIAIEEVQIRTQLSSRTTTLLQQVFKLQD